MDSIKKMFMLIVLVLIANFANSSDNFPSKIDRCKNEDKKCLSNAWNKYIKNSVPNGILEFDTPNLQSYFIEKGLITPGNGPLDIVLKLRNFNITGINKYVIDKIVGFPRDPKMMSKFVLIGRCPLIRFNGKYNVKGKVLVLPITGDGDAEVKFYNIQANITAETKTKVIEGKEYLVISKVNCNFITERNFYRFDNILNNKEISDSVNNILNENQDIINNEIRGPVGKMLSEHFKMFFNSAFKKYPYQAFFLDV